METSTTLCLYSTAESQTMIRFNFLSGFKGLAQGYEADAVIVSTEEGFSPLGASSTFLEEDLGISYENEIRKRARWNRD